MSFEIGARTGMIQGDTGSYLGRMPVSLQWRVIEKRPTLACKLGIPDTLGTLNWASERWMHLLVLVNRFRLVHSPE